MFFNAGSYVLKNRLKLLSSVTIIIIAVVIRNCPITIDRHTIFRIVYYSKKYATAIGQHYFEFMRIYSLGQIPLPRLRVDLCTTNQRQVETWLKQVSAVKHVLSTNLIKLVQHVESRYWNVNVDKTRHATTCLHELEVPVMGFGRISVLFVIGYVGRQKT